MNKGAEWLLVDTETDGWTEPIHIVEIAAQRMRGWEPAGERFRVLLNHNVPIPPAAVAIHGYTEEFLRKHGHEPERAHGMFRGYGGDLPVVAHNLSFDWNRALLPEWRRLGLAPVGRRGFCTLMLSRRVVDETKSYTLDALRLAFGISADFAHRAFGDVDTMVTLFQRVFRPRLEEAGVASFDDVVEFARKTPVAKCLCAIKSRARGSDRSPPAESLDSWYFIDAQEQARGPLPAMEILALMGGKPCRIWKEGMTNWLSSEECAEFVQSVRAPPPLAARRSAGPQQPAIRSIAGLVEVCRGIIADGVVTTDQVLFLSKWLEDTGVMKEWPGTEIAERVEGIMVRGVVTEEERSELLSLLERVDPDYGTAGRSEAERAAGKKTVKPSADESSQGSDRGIEIKLACSCGQRVLVDSTASGLEFNCPACGAVMHVPSMAQSHDAEPAIERPGQQLGRTTTKVELMCVGNSGGGYINAQVHVMWFEVLVDEARRMVDVIEHCLPIKSHRREKRINFCEYDVPEGVVCFYYRHVQTKPDVYESRFFRVDNGEFQALGNGAQCDFYTSYLGEYRGYDICSGHSREDVEENRARRAELDKLGPGVYAVARSGTDPGRPPRQSVSDMNLASVAQRGPEEEGATENQLNFLRSLGVQHEGFLASLGKSQASSIINYILENRDA
jgi:DNA polymerase-3 subunit epsilon